jgi:hypothetical protein
MRYVSYPRKHKKRNKSDFSQRITRKNQGEKAVDEMLFDVTRFTSWLALAHSQYAGLCQTMLFSYDLSCFDRKQLN